MEPPSSLDDLTNNQPFPLWVLEERSSALMLFCAGFYGHSDCVHVARAGLLDVVAVDRDVERLDAMRAIYPPEWLFVAADVFEWSASHSREYDLLVADPQTTHFEQAYDLLPRWCALGKTVVLGGRPDWPSDITVPRTDESAWLVFL